MAYLIRPNRTGPPDPVLVGGDEITFRVTSAESDGALVAFAVRMPAGGGPPVLHRHDASSTSRTSEGPSEEARALVVFAPGAATERFAREAGALAARGPAEMDDVLALAAAHGIEMTRPLEEAA